MSCSWERAGSHSHGHVLCGKVHLQVTRTGGVDRSSSGCSLSSCLLLFQLLSFACHSSCASYLFFPLPTSYIPVLQGKEACQMEGCLLLMASQYPLNDTVQVSLCSFYMQFLPTFSCSFLSPELVSFVKDKIEVLHVAVNWSIVR